MDTVKKVALIVVVASIVVGSAFGLFASSGTHTSRAISIRASAITLNSPMSCPAVPANFSTWIQLGVYANRTNLMLVSLTVIGASPSITLNMDLNKTAYAYYHAYNDTYETISIPMPQYWSPGTDVDVSVTYYYTDLNPTAPTAYAIGYIPVENGNLTC